MEEDYIGSSPRPISTGKLKTLRSLHLRPINQVVYLDPLGSLRSGSSYLGSGFTLICFQRLSDRYVATLQCRWRDNRYTRGNSVPVLSY